MAARSHCGPNNEGPVHGLNTSGKHYARYIWYRTITSCGGRGNAVERAGDGVEADEGEEDNGGHLWRQARALVALLLLLW